MRRVPLYWLLVALVSALVVAGCGGGDDEDGGNVSQGGEQQTTGGGTLCVSTVSTGYSTNPKLHTRSTTTALVRRTTAAHTKYAMSTTP